MTAINVALGWALFAGIVILLRGLTVAASRNAPSPPRTQAATGAQNVACVRGHYYQLNPARNTWVCATCHGQVPREVAS